MDAEEEYELAVDRKCFEIRLVQHELAFADVPDALTFSYGGDEEGREELLAELRALAATWDKGAAKLQKINDELDALKEERGPYRDPIVVKNLDVAINTAIETKTKIEDVVHQVAELKLDALGEWADDAQELIEKLAFPVSPLRLYDWRGLPRWYRLEYLYPFDELFVEPKSAGRPSWAALIGTPLTGIPAQIFWLVRKYIKPHQKALENAFGWVAIGLAIALFPYHPGYSFAALTVGITTACYWSGDWDIFFMNLVFWAVIYVGLLAWLG